MYVTLTNTFEVKLMHFKIKMNSNQTILAIAHDKKNNFEHVLIKL